VVFPPISPRAEPSDDAGDRLLLKLSDRILPLMSVNLDDVVDRTGVTCLGALL